MESQTSRSYFGYTNKQLTTIIIFGFSNLFANIIISLQAPFYPKEAEEKGATATEYGLVLGIFQLVVFIMSPVYGSIIGIVNPRTVFNLGILTTGTCACLFGFLDYFDDHYTFIVLSFVLRIIQACGDAAYFTASFTIIAIEFPEAVATTFAALETCSGVGLILGPTVGGALYEVGGFLLPFVTMGALLFITGIVTHFILPEPGITCSNNATETDSILNGSSSRRGIISLLKSPAVALAMFSVIVSASSIGFLVATLEPHLRSNFGLTAFHTGLVFIIDAGIYALFAPLWGRWCDRSSQPKYITLIGCILTFVGFLLIGPASFIPLATILWVTCVGLGIHGLGVGASLVSGFVQAMQDAVKSGFPDSVATYGLVSGIWTSAFALGSFIGPAIGGVLLDDFGFRLGCNYVLATQVAVAILVILFLCLVKDKSSSTDFPELKDEKNPLLLGANSSEFLNSASYDVLTERQFIPGPSKGQDTSKLMKLTYGAI